MDLFGIGSMMGAISDGIVGGLNYKNQKEALEEQKRQNAWANQFAEKNFDFAQKQYEEQKLREDNATQRKVADLEKAGFNKLMAAGQGASAGAGVGTISGGGSGNFTAPQLQLGIQESIDSIYNALKMNADISMSDMQKKLIEQEIISKQISSDLDIANTKNIDAKTKEQLYNYNKSRNMNLRTTDAVDNRYNTAKAAAAEVTKAAAEGIKKTQESYQRNLEAKKNYEKSAGKSGRRYGYGAGTEYY